MKVAIVNRTNLKNYGSLLQAYALCKAVEDLGHDSVIIWERGTIAKNYDFRLLKLCGIIAKVVAHPHLAKNLVKSTESLNSETVSERTVELFDEFICEHIGVKYYKHSQMNPTKIGKDYDKFICGSDQVWCSTTLYVDPLMYLRFAPKNKRIAYAPSLGRDFIPSYNQRQMRRYIMDIPFVSVRESMGQKLIKELTDRDAPVLVDPTLLISKEQWSMLKIPQSLNVKYLLFYFLSTPTKETQEKLLAFIAGKGNVIVALNSRLEYLEDKIKVLYPDCGPGEFIGYVSDADYVFTDSYHGMLFSIMYQKEFWSVEREYGDFDQSSRQRSLLATLGLTRRYIGKEDTVLSDIIDYKSVNSKLDAEIQRSRDYLKEALER